MNRMLTPQEVEVIEQRQQYESRLLDEFAGIAMGVLLKDFMKPCESGGGHDVNGKHLSEDVYAIADAMLAERKRREVSDA